MIRLLSLADYVSLKSLLLLLLTRLRSTSRP